MTKTEATRTVKAHLRPAGLGHYKVRSESCCGPQFLTVVTGDPESLRDILPNIPGVARIDETTLSVVMQWERAA